MNTENANSTHSTAVEVLGYIPFVITEIIGMFKASYMHIDQRGEVEAGGTYLNCTKVNKYESPLQISIVVLSVILILALSFMTKRVSFLKKVCFGRPGPVIPMRTLDNHDFGIEYTLAFLAVSEYLYLHIFDENTKLNTGLPIVLFVVRVAYVLLIAVLSYPIYVAITYRHLVGYLSGILLLFLDFLLSVNTIFYHVTCKSTDKAITTTFKTLFFALFTLTLLCTLIRRAFLHVKKNKFNVFEKEPLVSADESLCYEYVRNLLADNKYFRNKYARESEDSGGVLSTIRNNLSWGEIGVKVKRQIYKDIPGFRVPPKLLIGIAVGSYFAYHIAIDQIDELTPVMWRFFKQISSKYETTNMTTQIAFDILFNRKLTHDEPMDNFNAYRHVTFLYIHLLFACSIVALVFAFANSLLHSYLIFRNYRLHFHKIAKRGFSTIIDIKKAPPPDELVLGFVKFSGFQAAFILWSIIVVFFVVSFVLFAVVGFIVLPLFFINDSWVINLLKSMSPVLVTSLIFNYLQGLLVKYVFVREKGKLMEINNRRLFEIYCHLAFFLNVIMGLFGSLRRVFIWIFSGIVCFCRIDFTSLPEYIQGLDSGFMCYVGFLYTEQYHYNPTLRCFVHLLLRTKEELVSDGVITASRSPSSNRPNSREKGKINFVIKWKVSYTLVRNPQLISMKKIFKRVPELLRVYENNV